MNLRKIFLPVDKYIFTFIAITVICSILVLVSVQNHKNNAKHVPKIQAQTGAILDETGPYSSTDESIAMIHSLMNQLQRKIDALDAILAQYAAENERLELEKQGYKEQLDDFWELMNEEYDFEGHQERYMERVK